jgi:hypothetical protein
LTPPPPKNTQIEDLQGDFTDGVQFCNLLEIISSKKLPKWNAKPRIKAMKLENVSFGLQFLKKEGIKLVAIGPEDVVEPKLKLILGLIWTIILRYQIQVPTRSSLVWALFFLARASSLFCAARRGRRRVSSLGAAQVGAQQDPRIRYQELRE